MGGRPRKPTGTYHSTSFARGCWNFGLRSSTYFNTNPLSTVQCSTGPCVEGLCGKDGYNCIEKNPRAYACVKRQPIDDINGWEFEVKTFGKPVNTLDESECRAFAETQNENVRFVGIGLMSDRVYGSSPLNYMVTIGPNTNTVTFEECKAWAEENGLSWTTDIQYSFGNPHGCFYTCSWQHHLLQSLSYRL